MRRRRAPSGPAFPFLPIPKAIGQKPKSPPVKPPIKSALIKTEVAPVVIHEPGAMDPSVPYEDRMHYSVQQQGDGFVDQRMFQIQKTDGGWRACAMWRVEGQGEIPKFLELAASNPDAFNEVGNMLLGMDPLSTTVVNDGGLFLEERSKDSPFNKMFGGLLEMVDGILDHMGPRRLM